MTANSLVRPISTAANARPSARTAVCTSSLSSTAYELPAFSNIANPRRLGTTSLRRSSRLRTVSVCWLGNPVTLLPGRARLVMPPPVANTIGRCCLLWQVWRVVCVTMTSTFRCTILSAISAKCSLRPSTRRTSMTMLRPSTQPSPRSRCTNTANRATVKRVIAPKKPIVRVAGCARAAKGRTAAAPSQPLICRPASQNPDKNVVNDIAAYAFSLAHVQMQRSIGALA
jgi:hypothetical protein